MSMVLKMVEDMVMQGMVLGSLPPSGSGDAFTWGDGTAVEWGDGTPVESAG
jgi:hypothetical protein